MSELRLQAPPGTLKALTGAPELTMRDDQLMRYSRQVMLPELDIAGQQRLLDANVLLVGLGGLGAPCALYLAAAGIGCLTLVDNDQVELSNLARQIIHATPDIGKDKVTSANESLAQLNPDCKVHTHVAAVDEENLLMLLSDVDLVVDGSDNFGTRHAVNRACRTKGIPLVSGAAIRWEGQVAAFDFRQPNAPCYACLYPDSDSDDALNCAENGVAAPVVGIIGAMQALEVMKLIAGVGTTLAGYVLAMDAKHQQYQRLKLARAEQCEVCSGFD